MLLPPSKPAQVQLAPMVMPVVAVPAMLLLVEVPPQPVDVKLNAVGTRVLNEMYWIEPPVWVPVNQVPVMLVKEGELELLVSVNAAPFLMAASGLLITIGVDCEANGIADEAV